jgi:uncharacterized protein (TIGR03437 family)
VLILSLAGIALLVYAFSSGPPVAHTGGFGEPTCTACHFGTLNSGPGTVTVTAPATYASGQTYQITVRVADPQRTNGSQSRWGFEMSARTQGSQQAGTLDPTDGNTQCLAGPPAGPCQGTFNGIQYISHTTTGTRAGTPLGVNFTFDWTAPDTSAGPVVMHAAGNSANNSQSNIGDRIYTTSITIQPEPSGPTPTISDGGVVNHASFAPDSAPMAPGSIAAIIGTDLNDGSMIAFSNFGEDGKLLTALGGASVRFNGIAAPIIYSFSGQLGVQIPFQLEGEASASVEVTVDGHTSEPRTIFVDSAAPGIFTLNQAGTGQGTVLIANSGILAAPAGSIAGPSSRPAQRGESITIYCTGLGTVDPPVETGAPAGASETPTRATVLIDGLPAEVLYSGTAPGFVGLYRVDAMVPATAGIGDEISLVVAIGEKQSNPVTIAVGP